VTIHQFYLHALARPTGQAEVVMCANGAMVARIPHRGEPSTDERVSMRGWRTVRWSPAHTQVLLEHVGWNRRNIAVARPVAGRMQLTVVEDHDGTPCPSCGQ
jgi:hypothetical protein